MTLYYKVPKPIKTPFVTGEIVEVCDRKMNVMSLEKVKRAGPKVVALVGGRRFRASDGYWIGDTGCWPFPSIRHARKKR